MLNSVHYAKKKLNRYKQNLGYAFVNFTTEEGAFKLHSCWNGEGWTHSSKTRQITPAKLQVK